MKARIVYASMTGNDADMAEILEEDLQDYGFEVETSEASFTDASDYLENDLCIFITYTYGEGKMTDDVADFYDQEVKSTTESLTALIEPLLIAFLGVVVGGMIVALYLPIFQITSLIK